MKVHNKFYPKLKLDGVKGSKSQKLFGGSATAREAAIVLAEYIDEPYALPSAPPRAPRGSQLTEWQLQEKKDKRIGALFEEVNTLLGVPQETDEAEAAALEAEAAAFAAWRAAGQPQAQQPVVRCEAGAHGAFHPELVVVPV